MMLDDSDATDASGATGASGACDANYASDTSDAGSAGDVYANDIYIYILILERARTYPCANHQYLLSLTWLSLTRCTLCLPCSFPLSIPL